MEDVDSSSLYSEEHAITTDDQRAVEILERLGVAPDIEAAREVLADCQAEVD